jgi:hypothetical protein
MRQIADRLSLRRYLGYDIDEPVPDHSTLSKARDLLGRDLFQEVFDYSVRLCQAVGMVGGVHLSGDKTILKADASLDSLEPRIVHQTPEAFVARLFAENPGDGGQPGDEAQVSDLTQRDGYPKPLDVDQSSPLPPPRRSTSHVKPKRKGRGGKAKVGNATHRSRTDPDAALVARPDLPPQLAYKAEAWTDARSGVITHADASRVNEAEHETTMPAIARQREVLGLVVASISYDKACGQGHLYRRLRQKGIVAFVPRREQANATSGPGLYGLGDFAYDAEHGVFVCPAGRELKYAYLKVRWPTASRVWQAKPLDCKGCQWRSSCTKAARYRTLQVSIYQPEYEAMERRLAGPGARLAAIARRTGPELCFAEGKRWRGLARAKYRGLEKVRGQVLLTAAAQNLKKLVAWTWRHTKGVGKAAATVLQRGLLTVERRFPVPAIRCLHLLTYD